MKEGKMRSIMLASSHKKLLQSRPCSRLRGADYISFTATTANKSDQRSIININMLIFGV